MLAQKFKNRSLCVGMCSGSSVKFCIAIDLLYPVEYNIRMKEIQVFTLNDKEPFSSWLKSLDKVTCARVLERIKRMQNGNYGDFKKINSEISELRFNFGSGPRLYFSEIDNILILLLCGGDKSTQKNDIKKAQEYLKVWRENNDKI